MGGSSKPKQKVTEYYMSMHYGVCMDEVDEVTGIYYGEKEAWSGTQAGPGLIQINRPDLFGGVKKEGGVRGSVFVLPGGTNQVLPDELPARIGRTPANMPGYRGLTSLYFVATTQWDGTYPDVDPNTSEVVIPASGLNVRYTDGIVGFTAILVAEETPGSHGVLSFNEALAAGQVPATPGTAGLSNYTEGTNGRRTYLAARSRMDFLNDYELAPAPRTIRLQVNVIPVTGELRVAIEGVGYLSNSQAFPAGQGFTLFQASGGGGSVTITDDVSDSWFMPGTSPITDFI